MNTDRLVRLASAMPRRVWMGILGGVLGLVLLLATAGRCSGPGTPQADPEPPIKVFGNELQVATCGLSDESRTNPQTWAVVGPELVETRTCLAVGVGDLDRAIDAAMPQVAADREGKLVNADGRWRVCAIPKYASKKVSLREIHCPGVS